MAVVFKMDADERERAVPRVQRSFSLEVPIMTLLPPKKREKNMLKHMHK